MYVLLREPFLNLPGLIYSLIIDAGIITLVVLNVLRGYNIGVLRQFLGLMGFIVGMYFGVILVPFLIGASDDRLYRTVVTLGCVVGIGVFMGWVAEQIAKDILLLNWRPRVRKVGAVLGGVMSGVIALGAIWLVSAIYLNSSLGPLSTGLQRSIILRGLSAVLPTAPTVLTNVQTFIDPDGAPQVFVGLEPWPPDATSVATASDVENASNAQGPSVVQIEAVGCGSVFGGSGFVIAPNMVVTSAHVIAGVRFPVILDKHGAHATTTVLFDPTDDVAILRTSNLKGKPLSLASTNEKRGSRVVVLGYPDTGPFRASPGAILDKGELTGRDIYNKNEVTRLSYTVQADVRPGSSGSPLILPDGTVAGMVYARSLLADGIGYALASTQISQAISGLSSTSKPVGTGSCTKD